MFRMDKESFKARFRELYDMSGCSSITQFAKMLDMNRQSVDRYYNGERCPDAPALAQICEKMKISADWLLKLSDVKTTSAEIQNAVTALGITEAAAKKIVDPSVYGSMKDTFSSFIERDEFKDLLNDYKNLLELMKHITSDKRLVEYVSGEDYVIDNDGKVTISSPYKAISVIQSSMQLTCSYLCEDVRLERMSEITHE